MSNYRDHADMRSSYESVADFTDEALRKLTPRNMSSRPAPRIPRIPRKRDPFWQGVLFLVLAAVAIVLWATYPWAS